MGRKKRDYVEKHKQALGDVLENPETYGVRVSIAAARRRRRRAAAASCRRRRRLQGSPLPSRVPS